MFSKIWINLLFTGMFCTIVTTRVVAQAELRVELAEALRAAQANSTSLQLDSINIKEAELRQQRAQMQRLPDLQAQVSYLRISDNITPFRVQFPTGDLVLNPQVLDQSFNTLQLRQVVWAGGQQRASIHQAALERNIALEAKQRTQSDLVYRVHQLWFQLYVLQQSVEIVDANVRLLEQRNREIQLMLREGMLIPADTLKMRLTLTGLATTRSELTSQQRTISFMLAQMMGISTSTLIRVPDSLPPYPQQLLSIEQAIRLAEQNRPELRQISIRQQQASLATRLAKAAYLPTISIGGTYNYDRPNQRVFPNRAQLDGTWFAGFFLQWSASNLYKAKPQIRETQLQRSKMLLAEEDLLRAIRFEVAAERNRLEQAIQQLKLAEQSVAQADSNFQVERFRFEANTITTTDFLQANTLLIQAKLNRTTAEAQVHLTHQKFLQVIHQTN